MKAPIENIGFLAALGFCVLAIFLTGWALISLVGLCVLALFGWRLVDGEVRNRKLKRFVRREYVPIEQQFSEHYAGLGVSERVVRAAHAELERATGIPVELLRPTDRFDCELAPERQELFMSDWSAFVVEVRKRARELGAHFDQLEVRTVEDFVTKVGPILYGLNAHEPDREVGRREL